MGMEFFMQNESKLQVTTEYKRKVEFSFPDVAFAGNHKMK